MVKGHSGVMTRDVRMVAWLGSVSFRGTVTECLMRRLITPNISAAFIASRILTVKHQFVRFGLYTRLNWIEMEQQPGVGISPECFSNEDCASHRLYGYNMIYVASAVLTAITFYSVFAARCYA